ncbi:hypothetical protein PGT21_025464 [Puccinia graminis f. sp. tritici]|uniref:Uncharacterized protein n=1 Tax=Puccinia graminis f. sp. tritici TaxID=56615 RepID=A0A5B0NNU0_PUCGR|nr:hypothetical protein PGT21_025464 [Puccinia graminis f. sp. tritici]
MSFHTVGHAHAPAPFRLSKKASRKAPSSEVSTDRRSMQDCQNRFSVDPTGELFSFPSAIEKRDNSIVAVETKLPNRLLYFWSLPFAGEVLGHLSLASRPGFPPSNTLCACYQKNRKEQALPSVCCPPSVPLALSMNLGPPYTPPHGAADNLAVTLPTPGNVLCGTINKGCNTLPFVLRLLLTRLQAVDYQNTIAIDWATPHKAHLSPGSFWRRRHGD